MNNKQLLKALTTLAKSKGWEYLVNEVMEKEVLAVALSLTDSMDMPKGEIDFKRGTMFAARQLANLPERLIAKLENELVMEEAMAQQDDG